MSHHCNECNGNYDSHEFFELAQDEGRLCRHCIQSHILKLENDLEMAHGCTVHEELICVQHQIGLERKKAEALGKKIHRTHRKKWLEALDAIRIEIEK